MAERSTARSADGAARNQDEPTIDSWISRRSRLAGGVCDSDHEPQEPAAPQPREDMPDRYEEPYPPGDAQDAHQEHGERGAGHPPYGDAYDAQQVRYAQPEADHVHEELPHHGRTGAGEHRPGDSDARDPEARDPEARDPEVQGPEAYGDGRIQQKHRWEPDLPPEPANQRRPWLIPVGGLALVALLFGVAFMWWSGRPLEGAPPVPGVTAAPDAFGDPTTPAETPSAPASATTPRTSPTAPSATPSVTPSTRPAPAPTGARPTRTPSAAPVLIGPSSWNGVSKMVQRYCDRHSGGSADPRADGRWQCTRLLTASIVDMDLVCRETYGSDAYARTSKPGDAYAWRCYR